MAIPVIDLFAGPGGLGEGFSALLNSKGKNVFKIVLSIEKEYFAHQTLTLRSFFRQFDPASVPEEYYEYLKGKKTLKQLYDKYPIQSEYARKEALQATLGEENGKITSKDIDKRIEGVLPKKRNWLLIGGPPCQAYSVIGRSRRQETMLDEIKDERVGLYKQYLRILAVHNPAVFIMENVKGLLSAKTDESPVFSKILKDLSSPVIAFSEDETTNSTRLPCPGYKIYSLVVKPKSFDLEGTPVFEHKDFIIHAEKYGIPQARQRVILLGIRNDIDFIPDILKPTDEIPISKVLAGLPRLRGGLSKVEDNGDSWRETIKEILKKGVLHNTGHDVKDEIYKQIEKLIVPKLGTGKEYISDNKITCKYLPDWYLDPKLIGVCNHSSRGHMEKDLLRYFFVSCFARVKKTSPSLDDLPVDLLPFHKNVNEGIEDKKFADRFRVQIWNKPSKTITSHISKDGHYYIHPDPSQCRSFTVREAARIQTFPDNYFFCGPRTAQFIQVGNAVPPYLSFQIAEIVYKIYNKSNE